MSKGNKFLAFASIIVIGTSSYTTATSAQTHTVQTGESLWSISQQYSMTVDEIQTVNNLDSSLIMPNQKLTVTGDGAKYTIQPKDTLFGIAVAHSITVDELMKLNGLTSDLIYAGDTLVVGASATVSAEKVPVQSTSSKQEASQVKTPTAAAPDNVVKTMSMEASAYTAYCTGCSGITATGIDLRANPDRKVIAVDPKVIPLGSKVWVEGYGEAIAADTGGEVKGNKIDVFIPEKSSAYEWGRKTVQVKILK